MAKAEAKPVKVTDRKGSCSAYGPCPCSAYIPGRRIGLWDTCARESCGHTQAVHRVGE